MGAEIGNRKRKKLRDFITEANLVHNHKYDYSDFIYKNAHTKGIVICHMEGHGPWRVTPNDHLTRGGTGCPTCGYLKSGIYGITAFRKYPEYANEYNKLYYVAIDVEDYRKFGISIDTYSRDKSGKVRFSKIIHYRSTTRACAWVVEQHLLIKSSFAKLDLFPEKLREWKGRNEVRKNVFIDDEVVEMMDSLLDEAEDIG